MVRSILALIIYALMFMIMLPFAIIIVMFDKVNAHIKKRLKK